MFELKPILNTLIRSRVGAVLLMLQIAVTVAIVANASSIIKDRIDFVLKETGYSEEDLIAIETLIFAKGEDFLYLAEETERTLRDIDGVIHASFTQEIPLSGGGSASSFGILPNDQSDDEDNRQARAAYTLGGHTLIDTLDLKIIEGRMFNAEEVNRAPEPGEFPNVVVVTKDFIDELFPDGDGLGKAIYIGNHPVKIVGVVGRAMGPWPSDRAPYNLAFFAQVDPGSYQKFIVRTEPGMAESVQNVIEERLLEQFNQRVIMDNDLFVDSKQRLLAKDYLMLRMLIALIVLLVAITALGIFGMTVFNISKRTKQIGTRRALGARRSAIVRYFMVETALVCFAGLILGGIGAILLSQLLFENYSVPAFEYSYILYTAGFVLIISLLSVIFPANRAANISPSVATRSI